MYSERISDILEKQNEKFIKEETPTHNKMGGKGSSSNGQATTRPQYIAALCVCLGAVSAGTVLGWTGNISEKLKSSELNSVVVDEDSLGWIGSLATIGALLMCFPIGYICDLIGRKWACLTTVVPFTVGWLLIIFADNTGMIYAGRFLTGLAGGAFCVAAPIYTSEIGQKEIRGILGSFFQLLLTVGILISYLAGAFMGPQALSILCAMVPIVFGLLFFFQPETPVYYLKNNKPEAAAASLQKLRGSAYNSEEEMKEIKEAIDKNAQDKVSFFEAASSVASKKAILICFGLMFFQQMSGINAVIFYTGAIFDAAGSSLPSSTATIIVGVTQVIATFASSMTVDKFGRKLLLLASVFFMMLSGLVLGIFFSLKDRNLIAKESVDSMGFLPILCLVVFITFFSVGMGPIPWLIAAELMPEDIKSTACSAAATFNWFLAFLVTKFYANLKNEIGGDSTFYIFAGITLLSIFFILLVIPETKGKSLAEIQAILSGNKTDKADGLDNPTFKT